MEGSAKYSLMFEGPADPSVKTLQRIKGAFIADLELPIEEAQRILAQAPTRIIESESEDLISKYFEVLISAGANVFIVGPEERPPEKAEAAEASPQESASADSSGEIEFVPAAPLPPPTPPSPASEATPAPEASDITAGRVEAKLADDEQLFPGIKLQKPEPKPAPSEDKLFELDSPEAPAAAPPAPKPALQPSAPSAVSNQVLDHAALMLEDAGSELQEDPHAPASKAAPLAPDKFALLELDDDQTVPAHAAPKKAPPAPSAAPAKAEADQEFDLTLSTEPPVEEPPPVVVVPEDDWKEEPPQAVPEEEDDQTVDLHIAPEPRLGTEEQTASRPAAKAAPAPKQASKPAAPIPAPEPPPPHGAEDTETLANDNTPIGKLQAAASLKKEAPAEAPAEPPPLRPAPVRNSLHELLFMFVGGLVLLAGGNFFYHSLNEDNGPGFLLQITSDLLSQDAPSFTPVVSPEQARKTLISGMYRFEAKRDNAPRKVNGLFTMNVDDRGRVTAHVEGQILPPAPAEPTPEEIVLKKPARLWLHKIEFDTNSLTFDEHFGFEGAAVARFYVAQAKQRTRGIGKVIVRGVLADDRKSVKLTIQAFAGLDAPAEAEAPITPEGERGYKFSLSEEIVLARVTATAAPVRK